MSTNLTNPIDLGELTHQRIVSGGYFLQVDINGSVVLGNSYYEYVVDSYTAGGTCKRSIKERIPLLSVPVQFRDDLKALHNAAITDAKNKGLIASGTDSDDF